MQAVLSKWQERVTICELDDLRRIAVSNRVKLHDMFGRHRSAFVDSEIIVAPLILYPLSSFE